ncbi:MAG TPA: hypothetical protein ENO21_00475 [Firmicutes bacterium]|nr:hypothetical protein [Bacillota bacterium]
MFVPYLPNRRKGRDLELGPGEQKLGSYMVGATAYSWVLAATAGLVVAMGAGLLFARDGASGTAIASVLAGNAMLFGAMGKRRLYLTTRRLVLMQQSKHENSLDLADIRGIEVRGRKVGRVIVKALDGTELSASVYNPLAVAAAIQAACAELSEERKLNWKEAGSERAG